MNVREVIGGGTLVPDCQYDEQSPFFKIVGRGANGLPIHIPIGEELLSRHMLLLGGIGSGKTNAFKFLVRNIRRELTNRDVMLIFDTKGDYYREFYRTGDVVISNDERATDGNGPNYWNVFRDISIDGRTEENVIEIAKTLFDERTRTSSQPFFPNAARDLFSALLLDLLRSPEHEQKRNNASLRRMFDTFSVPAMKSILEKHSDLKAMRVYIEDEASGQTLGVAAELQQLVREVFIGNFAKRGSLSMRELVRNRGGRVIFIEYDLSIGAMLTPIFKLLIDLAIKQALCSHEGEGSVYFIIDEFRLLPHLQHIDNGVNFGRSLGAKFIIGVQNVDQISAAYGADLARSILSGFGTNISFRVNDANSRDFVKGLYGDNIQKLTYRSAIQSRGIIEQIHDGFVVEDIDITSLGIGWAIVSILNSPPFKFHFNAYN